MSPLLARARGTQGHIQAITPQRAGWHYVGFDAYMLSEGEHIHLPADDRERCLVLVGGNARISAADQDLGELGQRSGPFEGIAPYSVYLPAGIRAEVVATTALELAIASAPGAGGTHPVRIITPQDCTRETRGQGTNTRHVCNILPENTPAERLLVVEVITPGGHWSSYPPHRHDVDSLPEVSQLEETYYHRLSPPQGFAYQRVYTDDRSLDESITVEDKDVVMVPRGYHPVGAPHGYDLYYLNVMAGPQRVWRFHNDPQHAWMIGG